MNAQPPFMENALRFATLTLLLPCAGLLAVPLLRLAKTDSFPVVVHALPEQFLEKTSQAPLSFDGDQEGSE
jgi:hypothetical protein